MTNIFFSLFFFLFFLSSCSKKNINSSSVSQQSVDETPQSNTQPTSEPKVITGEKIEAKPVPIRWDEEKLKKANESLQQNAPAQPAATPSKSETQPNEIKHLRFSNPIPPK